MKKVILTIGILAGVSSTFAQEEQVSANTSSEENKPKGRVGINTNAPKATLHIEAYNKDTDTDNNPGLIIPTVSKDKLNKNAHEESTLVYYSGGSNSAYIDQNTGSTTENIGSKKGFYYYDGTDWQRIIRKAQFYMPSIVVPTTEGPHSINLYKEYIKQYTNQTNNSNNPLKTYKEDDLDYFVVYYDNNVFTSLNIAGNGVLTYTVTKEGAKNISAQTFMNIVLQER